MAGQSKETWISRRQHWARALAEIARAHGKDSDLYMILGNVAWGRYDGEPQPDELKDNVIFGAGFLQGVRYAALNAGRRFSIAGTDDLATIHDRIRKGN